MEAASNNHTEIVQILVHAGADVDSKDKMVSECSWYSVCLSGADLVVCCAGEDRAGLCKEL